MLDFWLTSILFAANYNQPRPWPSAIEPHKKWIPYWIHKVTLYASWGSLLGMDFNSDGEEVPRVPCEFSWSKAFRHQKRPKRQQPSLRAYEAALKRVSAETMLGNEQVGSYCVVDGLLNKGCWLVLAIVAQMILLPQPFEWLKSSCHLHIAVHLRRLEWVSDLFVLYEQSSTTFKFFVELSPQKIATNQHPAKNAFTGSFQKYLSNSVSPSTPQVRQRRSQVRSCRCSVSYHCFCLSLRG